MRGGRKGIAAWRRNIIGQLIGATDDKRIYKAAKGFGAKTVYTSKGHRSGSDRLTEVTASIDAKIVVNIQADEPLIHSSMIDDVVDPLRKNSGIAMAAFPRHFRAVRSAMVAG